MWLPHSFDSAKTQKAQGRVESLFPLSRRLKRVCSGEEEHGGKPGRTSHKNQPMPFDCGYITNGYNSKFFDRMYLYFQKINQHYVCIGVNAVDDEENGGRPYAAVETNVVLPPKEDGFAFHSCFSSG